MVLQDLLVLHQSKAHAKTPVSPDLVPGAFYLDTCQRWLWILDRKQIQNTLPIPEGMEVFQSQDAYRFLLQVATGLESQVIGETDIFGQFKQAWREFRCCCGSKLSFWIQKIFEDTKEIRTLYLRNLGGSSYGSLVRKLLKDHAAKGAVGLIGAGQIAKSISPFLLESELWLWNRTEEKCQALYQELAQRSHHKLKKLQSHEEETVWADASSIIICTPFCPEQDEKRVQWLKKSREDSNQPFIIHLGGMKDQAGIWNDFEGFYCLDDLFALQQKLNSFRTMQISLAKEACSALARQRALGPQLAVTESVEALEKFA